MGTGDLSGNGRQRRELFALPCEAIFHDLDDVAVSAPLPDEAVAGTQSLLSGRWIACSPICVFHPCSAALLPSLLGQESEPTLCIGVQITELLGLDLPGGVVLQQPSAQSLGR